MGSESWSEGPGLGFRDEGLGFTRHNHRGKDHHLPALFAYF